MRRGSGEVSAVFKRTFQMRSEINPRFKRAFLPTSNILRTPNWDRASLIVSSKP
jgi:hypothetical protein